MVGKAALFSLGVYVLLVIIALGVAGIIKLVYISIHREKKPEVEAK